MTLSSESSVTGDVSVGTDTLIGIDRVFGSGFDDTFTVDSTFSGNFGTFNEIEGGGGDDLITGNGKTRVGYLNADAGVFVDLGAGTASSLDEGDAANVGTDTFTGVRDVRGSQFGDTLVGSDGEGFENFRGMGGDDFIDGGAGDFDRVDYRNSPDSVFVDLSTGIAQDGFGGTDTLVNIERVRGADLGDDTLIGDAGDNNLDGRDGDDTLDGGAEQDFLDGGSGSDAFVFTTKDGSTRNLPGGQGFYGDIVSDYTTGEDRIVFEGMQGISYTGRVFEMVNGDPFGSTEDAIDADPSIQNEIVFILETGSEFTATGIQGHLYVKGSGTGVDFDQMHIMLHDVSVPPLVSDILFSAGPVNVVGTDEDDVLAGGDSDDTFIGLDGDTLIGRGDDTYVDGGLG